MSLSLIQGKSSRGICGAEGRGMGGPWVELSGKCWSTKASRDALVEVEREPSGSVR